MSEYPSKKKFGGYVESMSVRTKRIARLARDLETFESADAGAIRQKTLDVVMEASGADLTIFYNVAEFNGRKQMCDLQIGRGWDPARIADLLYSVSETAHSMLDITRPPQQILDGFWGVFELFEREDFKTSALYRDCWAPLGIEDGAAIFVFHGAELHGSVGAYSKELRFSAQTRELLAPLVAPCRAAITAAHVLTRQQLSGESGFLVARPDGSIESASGPGEEWRKIPGFDTALAIRVRQFDSGKEPTEMTGFGHAEARVVRLETTSGTRYLVAVRPFDTLCMDSDLLLTPAQMRVAELAAIGLTNAEIAGELGRSAETVQEHLHDIYRRLHVSNRAELAEMLGRRVTRE